MSYAAISKTLQIAFDSNLAAYGLTRAKVGWPNRKVEGVTVHDTWAQLSFQPTERERYLMTGNAASGTKTTGILTISLYFAEDSGSYTGEATADSVVSFFQEKQFITDTGRTLRTGTPRIFAVGLVERLDNIFYQIEIHVPVDYIS